MAPSACGDDSPVPIDEIPEETKVTELSNAEAAGVCDWGDQLFRDIVPAGTNCRGVPLTYDGCMFDRTMACSATVGELEVCLPALLERIVLEPCDLYDLGPSLPAVMAFVEAIPGCETLAPCVTVTM